MITRIMGRGYIGEAESGNGDEGARAGLGDFSLEDHGLSELECGG